MVVVVMDDAGEVLVEKTKMGCSSNIAELWAVTEAMLYAKEFQLDEIEVFTDSRNDLGCLTLATFLCVRQVMSDVSLYPLVPAWTSRA